MSRFARPRPFLSFLPAHAPTTGTFFFKLLLLMPPPPLLLVLLLLLSLLLLLIVLLLLSLVSAASADCAAAVVSAVFVMMMTTSRISVGGTEGSLRTLSAQNRICRKCGEDAPCGGALSGGNA